MLARVHSIPSRVAGMRKGSVWWHAMSLAGTGNRQRRWIDQVSSVISVKPLAAIPGERASGLSATYRPTQSRLGRRLQGMASGSSSFFIARGGILRIPDTFGPRLRGLLRVSTGLKSKYQNQHRQDDASPQIDSTNAVLLRFIRMAYSMQRPTERPLKGFFVCVAFID
jgi:hypothetical protein